MYSSSFLHSPLFRWLEELIRDETHFQEQQVWVCVLWRQKGKESWRYWIVLPTEAVTDQATEISYAFVSVFANCG